MVAAIVAVAASTSVVVVSAGSRDSVELSLLGRHTGGGAEISGYDPRSQRLFVTDADNKRVDVVSIADPANPAKVAEISVAPGSPTSVAVRDGLVAIAVMAPVKTDQGSVRLYDVGGAAVHPGVTVGALPDMLTFTPNGEYLLVANEGEPSGYGVGHADPDGSVSVIRVGKDAKKLSQADVRTASLGSVTLPAGVRIFGPGATDAQDLEPEYIAPSNDSKTAWITLQENNAIAELDVRNATITRIWPLGFKDHMLAGNGLDPSDRDGIGNGGRTEIVNRPVFGMYLPDGVAAYEERGETYLVTANEGDARDWPGLDEEARVSDLTLEAGVVTPPELVANSGAGDLTAFGRLTVTRANGNTDADPAYEQLYAFGARSFSIWAAGTGEQVFDSGDALEQITRAQVPALFNGEGGAGPDTRSDNKGPEPEGVAVGRVGDRVYAFIGLERIGGVIVYDVSSPAAPKFVQYLNPAPAVDRAPEGVLFIPAKDSPTRHPLLVLANEVSGTTTIYDVVPR
jgi:hypothetical protein